DRGVALLSFEERGIHRLLARAPQVPKRARFFFQAEDGIRDYKVTGVQTCALPISLQPLLAAALDRGPLRVGPPRLCGPGGVEGRSEERRVGKECRSRWAVEQ